MRQNLWAKHYQLPWADRAGDPRLPNWLRVAALAYGKHGANGHAPFGPGDIALVLADPTTGVVPDRRNVSKDVKRAVELGWLAPASGTRCLIVPASKVSQNLGDHRAPCPWHDRRTRRIVISSG